MFLYHSAEVVAENCLEKEGKGRRKEWKEGRGKRTKEDKNDNDFYNHDDLPRELFREGREGVKKSRRHGAIHTIANQSSTRT